VRREMSKFKNLALINDNHPMQCPVLRPGETVGESRVPQARALAAGSYDHCNWRAVPADQAARNP
jgi:hypothetical protein